MVETKTEDKGFSHTFAGMREILPEALALLQRRSLGRAAPGALATGFLELDRMIGGLHPGELTVVGARPAMGKTTFALNIVEHVATQAKKSVAVFSMEISAPELVLRLICSIGRLDAERMRTGDLGEEDWMRVEGAVRMLEQTRIFIDETPLMTPALLRSRCQELKRDQGLDLVVVDDLQGLWRDGDGEEGAGGTCDIASSLKGLAKELSVPVMAISQLRRSLESRRDRRPVLADLRDAGAIAEHADVVLFIYRDEYYNKEDPRDRSRAEIIMGRHRGGPTGVCILGFRGKYFQYENLWDDEVGTFE